MNNKALLVVILFLQFFFAQKTLFAEKIVYGDYGTAGTVNEDLIVVNGSIVIVSGDLTVQGDVKVTEGTVMMLAGDLDVNGDLIVSNSNPLGSADATIDVTGDLAVNGAVITKSDNGPAWVRVQDPSTTGAGSLLAGRVSLCGATDATLTVDHDIKVTGAILTRSVSGSADVESNGALPNFGDISAGSIYTYAPLGSGYVSAGNGHIKSPGKIATRAQGGTYVYAEGNIEANTIFTNSDNGDGNISGEKVYVVGNIRTKSNGNSSVEARETSLVGQEGTFEDLSAANIYARSVNGDAEISARRNISVQGDLVTRSPAGYGDIFAGNNFFAHNVFTKAYNDGGISVGGEIDVQDLVRLLTDQGVANVTSGGQIRVGEMCLISSSSSAFLNAGDSLLSYGMISVSGQSDAHVIADDITAKNIYTHSDNDSAFVQASSGFIDLEKDIITSAGGNGSVVSSDYIKARSIFTAGDIASVEASNDIFVKEYIITDALNGDGYVLTEGGDLQARRIKPKAAVGFDDSIKANGGSAAFQLVMSDPDVAKTIKNSEFSLDSDYDWNTQLTLEGTCTLNGRGHQLNFGEDGAIVVASGGACLLKNVTLNNLAEDVIRCEDDMATMSFADVVWTQTGNTWFSNGTMQIVGDLTMSGSAGTAFTYQSNMTSSIHEFATLSFDRGMTFSYGSSHETGIWMIDDSSTLHFDGAYFGADEDVRFKNGTLMIDNLVTVSVAPGKTVYLVDGNSPEDLSFRFNQSSKLKFFGLVI